MVDKTFTVDAFLKTSETPTISDFIDGPLTDHGLEVTYIPVTRVTNNMTGENELTDGTAQTITVVFENANTKYDLLKAGQTKGADARMFVKPTDTINKEDKITHNSITYRVETVSMRRFKKSNIFQTVLLYRV